ncbi:MAG: hypothetical protein PWQ77_863 [Kosmotogales bacterium]|nr:hypothetical protein [Kosmotogales bacterium]
MISSFIKEKFVNKEMAIIAVVLSIIAAFTMLAGIGFIFQIISSILTFIVLYQWSQAIKTNIQNTQMILGHIRENIQDASKKNAIMALESRLKTIEIYDWAFWVYLICAIVGYINWYVFFINLIGFVFLAIYLQNLFQACKKLQEAKNKVYQYVSSKFILSGEIIKDRNIGMFILLAIVTIGIYWYYILIKMSYEINEFLQWDIDARERVISEFKQ